MRSEQVETLTRIGVAMAATDPGAEWDALERHWNVVTRDSKPEEIDAAKAEINRRTTT